MCGSVPLCANTKCRPHSTRLNGWVFSTLARPRVFLRTCATASSVLMGCFWMNSAIALVQAGLGSRKVWANLPWYRATPHPSACGPVFPPRITNPVKEKTMSVGTLHSIPRSSHMVQLYFGGARPRIQSGGR